MKVCNFDGCDKKHYGKGFCNAHWEQQRKGNPLTPLYSSVRRGEQIAAEVAQGYLTCSRCRLKKPLSEIGKATGSRSGFRSNCLECESGSHRFRKYGLSQDVWEALFNSQGRVCRICRTDKHGGMGWSTDHDHNCCPGEKCCGKCVRGILCAGCNSALGFLEDHMDAAKEYLSSPIHWLTDEQEALFDEWCEAQEKSR